MSGSEASAGARMANARIREALQGTTNIKEKGPQVADGILSVTPDTPEVVEWRARSALDCAGTSSTYLDDEDDGPKPHELYGKFTWKIDNFSEISKRELRSNVFDVGNYKWYILVYPQGCDVCNHLSLFLCVADYDKLLPGWSHFAQFTIAVVNKDPKKSKYSDTLHRFCKKEHDWGWKKFMELSKVLDGFTVSDTLVIKAQVQVILDKPNKPFRCLDPHYRRELVRVYLTNVEGLCRRFCDEKRTRLAWVREDPRKFREFWDGLSSEQQRSLTTERGEVVLKGIVKQFFNEKEVTSTLVMDALYSGCRQIEEYVRLWAEGRGVEGPPSVVIKADRNIFFFGCDVHDIVDRTSRDFIPPYKDDKMMVAQDITVRSGQEGEDLRKDSVERDEKRLAELGKRTVEMYVIAHIFTERLEISYREAEALRRQDQLIAEEEAASMREESRLQAKAASDKEKRAKKKEKKKQKKEADRVKKEAEEEERRRAEDERRLEVEKKAKEVADKKRAEEEAQAVQQQKRAAAAAAVAAALPSKASSSTAQTSTSTQQQAAGTSGKASGPGPAAPAQASSPRYASSSRRDAGPAAASTSTSAAYAADDDAPGTSEPSTSTSQRHRPAAAPSTSSSTGDDDSDDSLDDSRSGDTEREEAQQEIATLKDRVVYLERALADREAALADRRRAVAQKDALLAERDALLAERDSEIMALRSQLQELQTGEIADLVRMAADKAAQVAESKAADKAVGPAAAARPGTPSSPMSSDSSSNSTRGAKHTEHHHANGYTPSAKQLQPERPSSSGGLAQQRPVAPPAPGHPGTPQGHAAAAADGSKDPAGSSAPSPQPAAARRLAPALAAQVPATGSFDSASASSTGLAPPQPLGRAQSGMPRMMSSGPAPMLMRQGHPDFLQQPQGTASDLPTPLAPLARSSSATLPAGSTTLHLDPLRTHNGAGQQLPVGPSTAATRPRPAMMETAPSGQSQAPIAKPSQAAAFAPTSSAPPAPPAQPNGTQVPISDGVPSYRNAAAGLMPPAMNGPVSTAAPAVPPAPPVSTAPIAPPAAAPAPAAPAAGPSPSPSSVSTPTKPAAAEEVRNGGQLPRHLNSVAPDTRSFQAAGPQLMLPQPGRGQPQRLGFGGIPPQKRASNGQNAATQSEPATLDDFAHMGLIDDLLME